MKTTKILSVCATLVLVAGFARAEEWRYNVNHRTNGEWWGGDAAASNPITDAEGWTTFGSGTAGWARGVVTDRTLGGHSGKTIRTQWTNWAGGTYNIQVPNTIPPGGTPFGAVNNVASGAAEVAIYSWLVELNGVRSDRWWAQGAGEVFRFNSIGGGLNNFTWSLTTPAGGSLEHDTYYPKYSVLRYELVINVPVGTGTLYVAGAKSGTIDNFAIDTEANIRAADTFGWELHSASGSSSYYWETAVEGLLLGDANKDNLVDIQDFSSLKPNFGSPAAWNDGEWNWGKGNFNFDDLIDAQDFSILKEHLSDHAPEPVSIALVALGGLGVLLRKRRR